MRKLRVDPSRPFEQAFPEVTNPNPKKYEHKNTLSIFLMCSYVILLSGLIFATIINQTYDSWYYKIVNGTPYLSVSEICVPLLILAIVVVPVLFFFVSSGKILYNRIKDGNILKNDNTVLGDLKGNVTPINLVIVAVFLGLIAYAGIHDIIDRSNYYKKIEMSLMHESHKCIGEIYKINVIHNDNEYQKHYYYTGIDEYHLSKKILETKNPTNFIKGHKVLLRVSDNFPRINIVLNWYPTKEELNKYKVPVKLIEK